MDLPECLSLIVAADKHLEETWLKHNISRPHRTLVTKCLRKYWLLTVARSRSVHFARVTNSMPRPLRSFPTKTGIPFTVKKLMKPIGSEKKVIPSVDRKSTRLNSSHVAIS